MSANTPSPSSFMAWLVCLCAGLFFFYEFFQLNVFDVINPGLRQDFHIDAKQLSWMSSAFVWANVLFLLPAGFMLDRFAIRPVILSALVLCVAGTLGFGLAQSWLWASFFHALAGIGNAFCFLSCVVLVSRWFLPEHQAFVLGCIVTMAFIGGMMAHTPFAYLTLHFGWRMAMIIDAGIGVVILLLIALIVKDHSKQESSSDAPKAWWSGFKVSLQNPQNWLAGVYTACLNLPIMVLCALWGGNYLQEVHLLGAITASNIISMIFIGSILGCPLMGWLSDRQGKRKPLMIIGAIATLLTLIPLFTHAHLSPAVLSLIFFALGFFTSTQVISYPLIAESNLANNTGTASGLASILIMGGGGLAQVIFGYLMQHHAGASVSRYAQSDFQFAFWMFPIAALLALLAIVMTRETYCRST